MDMEMNTVKHALVIEDSVMIAIMLQDHLKASGFATIDIASTQGEAIQLAEERCPQLITADDRLEDGTGVAAIRHICRENAIPVVFIVADPRNVQTEIPHAQLLRKPFSESALDAAIRDAERSPLLCA